MYGGVDMFLLKKETENQNQLKHFEELISLEYKQLYTFLFYITKDKQLAEDALQNTMLIAYVKLHTLNHTSKFKSWIFVIGKREALKIVKKYKREVPQDELALDLIKSSQDFLLTEKIILDNELKEATVQAIQSLKSELQEIIFLHYYNDLSFKEISLVLGVNSTLIRVRHMKAKEKICKFLNQHYFKL